MSTVYEKIVSVICKPPSQRTDFEAQEIVPWFLTKSPIFASVKQEIVKDVIRQCGFLRCQKDDVIIKQGDNGDTLYIVLKGQVSIYVIQDKDNNEEVLAQVNATLENRVHDLDRSGLGQKVWTTGEGNAFGEIALIKPDCIRTASVVIDEQADLMVVDRNLYNQSVRDVLEEEFQAKTRFVENNPLFRSWSARHRKQLAISLRMERWEFGSPLVRQGHPANRAYFIHSGEVEISIHPGLHKSQLPSLWEEMESKLPVLTEGMKPPTGNIAPHEELKRRKNNNSKHQEIGLLGENEFVGCLEFSLRLDTYLYSATCTAPTELLVLNKEQYERFFEKRYPETIPEFRKQVGLRVDLYLQRIQDAPLMEYSLLLLEDSYLLRAIGSKSTGGKFEVNEVVPRRLRHPSVRGTTSSNIAEVGSYKSLMDNLQKRYISTRTCEPDNETGESSLQRLERRIADWLAAMNVGKKMSAGSVQKMKRFKGVAEIPRPGNRVIQSSEK